jgi:hypothetical protein
MGDTPALSDEQHRALDRPSKLPIMGEFYLAGGSALAVHLEHRRSVDSALGVALASLRDLAVMKFAAISRRGRGRRDKGAIQNDSFCFRVALLLRLRLRAAMSATPSSDAVPAPSFAWPGAAEHPPELPELVAGAATQWPLELHTFGGAQSVTEVHVLAHFPVLSTQI